MLCGNDIKVNLDSDLFIYSFEERGYRRGHKLVYTNIIKICLFVIDKLKKNLFKKNHAKICSMLSLSDIYAIKEGWEERFHGQYLVSI